jgi:hypothetical protein
LILFARISVDGIKLTYSRKPKVVDVDRISITGDAFRLTFLRQVEAAAVDRVHESQANGIMEEKRSRFLLLWAGSSKPVFRRKEGMIITYFRSGSNNSFSFQQ